MPDSWIGYHGNRFWLMIQMKTVSQNNVGNALMGYCSNTLSQTFHKIIGGAKRESHLYKWKLLIYHDTPEVKYLQEKGQECCA